MTHYPLATPAWDEREIAAIHKVIDSGMFTMGKHVSDFEQAFAEWNGSRFCVMVNSGSSANLLMVAALRYRKTSPLLPGDEVIVPAVSWSTTYFPLCQYGLKLRFVDIDKNTLNFDLDALAQAITSETRAILAVNLLGNPNDFSRIGKIVGDRDILLLEDNCESLGAELKGKKAGSFGLMGSFSSFFSHHISTMEGGMIITDDEELYHILLALRSHGWTRNLPEINHVSGSKSADPFEESFRFVLPGYNLRPLEMSGAIGLVQLEKLPNFVATRRKNAEQFLEVMKDFPFLRSQQETGQSSWFGFSMVLEKNAPVDRGQLLEAFGRNGIEVRPVVGGNFTKNEAMRWIDYEIHKTLTNADDVDSRGFFVGNHHYPLDAQLELLRKTLGQSC